RSRRAFLAGSLALALTACAAPAAPTAAPPAASAAKPAATAEPPKPAAGEKPAALRVGLVPNQAPDKIRAQYQPFGDYLSKALDKPVELFVATDYSGVVEAMASDK